VRASIAQGAAASESRVHAEAEAAVFRTRSISQINTPCSRRDAAKISARPPYGRDYKSIRHEEDDEVYLDDGEGLPDYERGRRKRRSGADQKKAT
jgi:hypothetical protein